MSNEGKNESMVNSIIKAHDDMYSAMGLSIIPESRQKLTSSMQERYTKAKKSPQFQKGKKKLAEAKEYGRKKINEVKQSNTYRKGQENFNKAKEYGNEKINTLKQSPEFKKRKKHLTDFKKNTTTMATNAASQLKNKMSSNSLENIEPCEGDCVPFWIWFSALMSNAAYSYPEEFQYLLHVYMSNEGITKNLNKAPNTIKNDGVSGQKINVGELNKSINKTNTSIYNNYTKVLGSNNEKKLRDFKNKYYKNSMGEWDDRIIGLAGNNNEKDQIKSVEYKYIFIKTTSDMNCYVIYIKKDGKTNIYVVFRGTNSTQSFTKLRVLYPEPPVDNIYSSLDDTLVSKNEEGGEDRTILEKGQKIMDGKIYRILRSQTRGGFHRIIYAIKLLVGDEKINNIFTFGHSLGGGLATIFSYYYDAWKKPIQTILNLKIPEKINLITWGAIKIGNINFKKTFKKMGNINAIRAKTKGDLYSFFPKVRREKSKETKDIYHVVDKPYKCESLLEGEKHQNEMPSKKELNITQNQMKNINLNGRLEEDENISDTFVAPIHHMNSCGIDHRTITTKNLTTEFQEGRFNKRKLYIFYYDNNKTNNIERIRKRTINNYKNSYVMSMANYNIEFGDLPNQEKIWEKKTVATEKGYKIDGKRINDTEGLGTDIAGPNYKKGGKKTRKKKRKINKKPKKKTYRGRNKKNIKKGKKTRRPKRIKMNTLKKKRRKR
jgi:hypothetical protein